MGGVSSREANVGLSWRRGQYDRCLDCVAPHAVDVLDGVANGWLKVVGRLETVQQCATAVIPVRHCARINRADFSIVVAGRVLQCEGCAAICVRGGGEGPGEGCVVDGACLQGHRLFLNHGAGHVRCTVGEGEHRTGLDELDQAL